MIKKRIYIAVSLLIALLLLATPILTSAQYDDSITDSDGDVFYWKETETGWRWQEGVERPNIDIIRTETTEDNGNILVSLEVKGAIINDDAIIYMVYLEDEEGDSYTLNYHDGSCWIYAPQAYEQIQADGIGSSTLEMSFSLAHVGDPSELSIARVETYDWIDAEGEGEYYHDTAGPEAEPPTNGNGNDDDLDEELLERLWAGSMICIALVIIVPLVVIIIIVVVVFKLLKSDEEDDQQKYQQQPPPPSQ